MLKSLRRVGGDEERKTRGSLSAYVCKEGEVVYKAFSAQIFPLNKYTKRATTIHQSSARTPLRYSTHAVSRPCSRVFFSLKWKGTKKKKKKQ
jgi:hypothetical protein